MKYRVRGVQKARETYYQRWRRERKLVQFFLKKEEYAKLEKIATSKGKTVRDLVLEAAMGMVDPKNEAYRRGYEEGYKVGLKKGREMSIRATGMLSIEVGGERFVVREIDWRALEGLVEWSQGPSFGSYKPPLTVMDLIRAMADARALYYDGFKWRIDYNAIKISRL